MLCLKSRYSQIQSQVNIKGGKYNEKLWSDGFGHWSPKFEDSTLISQSIYLLTQWLALCPWYEGHGDVIDLSFYE